LIAVCSKGAVAAKSGKVARGISTKPLASCVRAIVASALREPTRIPAVIISGDGGTKDEGDDEMMIMG
jgi:hypothetical protein